MSQPFLPTSNSPTPARQAQELDLLRRYQHALLFGGGALLSVLIVLAAGLALYNAASNAFANLRTTLATHSAGVQLDIEEKQAAMRRGVVNAELLWNSQTPPAASTLEAFVRDGGHVTLQAGAHLTPALAAVDVARTSDLYEFAPHLGMLEMQAYSVTAVAQLRHSPLGAYGYTPDHRLLTLMPAPEGGLQGVLARPACPTPPRSSIACTSTSVTSRTIGHWPTNGARSGAWPGSRPRPTCWRRAIPPSSWCSRASTRRASPSWCS